MKIKRLKDKLNNLKVVNQKVLIDGHVIYHYKNKTKDDTVTSSIYKGIN